FSEILAQLGQQDGTMRDAEMDIIGTSHAAVGAYLLGLWGLPDQIINAAAFHHGPDRNPVSGMNTTIIAHVANALANAGPRIDNTDMIVEGLDYELLKNNNLLPSLSGWRKTCAAHIVDRDH
ncbi:MAG: HDOD domain-containing protein, partial [Desulfobacteraceae bacterium]